MVQPFEMPVTVEIIGNHQDGTPPTCNTRIATTEGDDIAATEISHHRRQHTRDHDSSTHSNHHHHAMSSSFHRRRNFARATITITLPSMVDKQTALTMVDAFAREFRSLQRIPNLVVDVISMRGLRFEMDALECFTIFLADHARDVWSVTMHDIVALPDMDEFAGVPPPKTDEDTLNHLVSVYANSPVEVLDLSHNILPFTVWKCLGQQQRFRKLILENVHLDPRSLIMMDVTFQEQISAASLQYFSLSNQIDALAVSHAVQSANRFLSRCENLETLQWTHLGAVTLTHANGNDTDDDSQSRRSSSGRSRRRSVISTRLPCAGLLELATKMHRNGKKQLKSIVFAGSPVLSDMDFADRGLCGALRILSGLRYLKLENIGLDADRMQILVQTIRTGRSHLERLDLSRNAMENDCATAMGRLGDAATSSQLQELNLQDNRITTDGAIALFLAFGTSVRGSAMDIVLKQNPVDMCRVALTLAMQVSRASRERDDFMEDRFDDSISSDMLLDDDSGHDVSTGSDSVPQPPQYVSSDDDTFNPTKSDSDYSDEELALQYTSEEEDDEVNDEFLDDIMEGDEEDNDDSSDDLHDDLHDDHLDDIMEEDENDQSSSSGSNSVSRSGSNNSSASTGSGSNTDEDEDEELADEMDDQSKEIPLNDLIHDGSYELADDDDDDIGDVSIAPSDNMGYSVDISMDDDESTGGDLEDDEEEMEELRRENHLMTMKVNILNKRVEELVEERDALIKAFSVMGAVKQVEERLETMKRMDMLEAQVKALREERMWATNRSVRIADPVRVEDTARAANTSMPRDVDVTKSVHQRRTIKAQAMTQAVAVAMDRGVRRIQQQREDGSFNEKKNQVRAHVLAEVASLQARREQVRTQMRSDLAFFQAQRAKNKNAAGGGPNTLNWSGHDPKARGRDEHSAAQSARSSHSSHLRASLMRTESFRSMRGRRTTDLTESGAAIVTIPDPEATESRRSSRSTLSSERFLATNRSARTLATTASSTSATAQIDNMRIITKEDRVSSHTHKSSSHDDDETRSMSSMQSSSHTRNQSIPRNSLRGRPTYSRSASSRSLRRDRSRMLSPGPATLGASNHSRTPIRGVARNNSSEAQQQPSRSLTSSMPASQSMRQTRTVDLTSQQVNTVAMGGPLQPVAENSKSHSKNRARLSLSGHARSPIRSTRPFAVSMAPQAVRQFSSNHSRSQRSNGYSQPDGVREDNSQPRRAVIAAARMPNPNVTFRTTNIAKTTAMGTITTSVATTTTMTATAIQMTRSAAVPQLTEISPVVAMLETPPQPPPAPPQPYAAAAQRQSLPLALPSAIPDHPLRTVQTTPSQGVGTNAAGKLWNKLEPPSGQNTFQSNAWGASASNSTILADAQPHTHAQSQSQSQPKVEVEAQNFPPQQILDEVPPPRMSTLSLLSALTDKDNASHDADTDIDEDLDAEDISITDSRRNSNDHWRARQQRQSTASSIDSSESDKDQKRTQGPLRSKASAMRRKSSLPQPLQQPKSSTSVATSAAVSPDLKKNSDVDGSANIDANVASKSNVKASVNVNANMNAGADPAIAADAATATETGLAPNPASDETGNSTTADVTSTMGKTKVKTKSKQNNKNAQPATGIKYTSRLHSMSENLKSPIISPVSSKKKMLKMPTISTPPTPKSILKLPGASPSSSLLKGPIRSSSISSTGSQSIKTRTSLPSLSSSAASNQLRKDRAHAKNSKGNHSNSSIGVHSQDSSKTKPMTSLKVPRKSSLKKAPAKITASPTKNSSKKKTPAPIATVDPSDTNKKRGSLRKARSTLSASLKMISSTLSTSSSHHRRSIDTTPKSNGTPKGKFWRKQPGGMKSSHKRSNSVSSLK